MNKLRMSLFLALTLCGIAAAQTTNPVTYTIPTGITCTGASDQPANPHVVETCTMHNMQVEQPTDGTTLPSWALPFAYFSGGGYWQQIDFQQFMGQNPAASAEYCPGTGSWQNSGSLFTYDCTTTSDGKFALHTEIQAHSYQVGPYPCGGPKGSRISCFRYDWAIDSGFVNVTSLSSQLPEIVGGPGDGH
jgi:hypothetical protein